MDIQKIQDWLADRQRKYADGVALFKEFAPDDMRNKLLPYFSASDNPPTFDNHFTVLINKLTAIVQLQGKSPVMSVQEKATQVFKTVGDNALSIDKAAKKAQGDSLLKTIKALESEVFALQDCISELDDSEEEKDDEIAELEAELESKNDELQEMQERLDVLHAGVKVITYSGLPDDIRLVYDEIRHITPLYAAAFTEMQNEKLTPEERLPIAEEVNRLWDRRAELWSKMDAWAEGKNVTLDIVEPKMEDLPSDKIQKGALAAQRIERLKENIRRTEKAIEGHEKAGKTALKEKAEQRLADYQKELEELEKMIK